MAAAAGRAVTAGNAEAGKVGALAQKGGAVELRQTGEPGIGDVRQGKTRRQGATKPSLGKASTLAQFYSVGFG